MLVPVLILAAAAACAIAFWLHRRQTGSRPRSNVVALDEARRRKGKPSRADGRGKTQPCSLCRQPSARLAFYADENGQVLGVCKACKPKLSSRKLDRL
ncbi:hypothetical protein HGI30_11445 [Paenibacillus albicereus]|uniref:Uncharacterized protein n=1 Tax=Paenibacillus albicereus TaxID=2726185 RepID=A0A6H2GYB0_9BACL|nr:hypothetical protein [Paenibacillus albicereus]QJC52108.1 hypothetical protein HGI30_11445 [Paenibacillus albicereus]